MDASKELLEWIKREEVGWWAFGLTMFAVVGRVKMKAGVSRISEKEVRKLLIDAGVEWFRRSSGDSLQRRLKNKRLSTSRAVNSKRWEKIRDAVVGSSELIQGRGIDIAVKVVNQKTRCNKELLEGLPKRLHVWEKE